MLHVACHEVCTEVNKDMVNNNLSTTAPRRRGEEVGSAGGIYSASTATVHNVEARKAMSQDFAMSHQQNDKHSRLSHL